MDLNDEQLETLAGELRSVTEQRKALKKRISDLNEAILVPR